MGKSGPATARWIVTQECPLDPCLFAPRFRQGVGTLVAHGKPGVCARNSINVRTTPPVGGSNVGALSRAERLLSHENARQDAIPRTVTTDTRNRNGPPRIPPTPNPSVAAWSPRPRSSPNTNGISDISSMDEGRRRGSGLTFSTISSLQLVHRSIDPSVDGVSGR